MTTPTAHVGVAVDPPLLADLLVRLLKTPRRYVHRATTNSAHSCQIALITSAHENAVTAPVIVRLPDNKGNAGVGTITDAHGVTPVKIATVDDILAALER